MEPPKTFEETLRDLLRSSPYLVISVLFHVLLLVLFANLDGGPAADDAKTIKASAEELEEPIPPPPPPPEPEVEKVDEIIEDPVVSEVDTNETFEEFEQVESQGEFDSTGLNDVIGVGGGGGGNFGKLGKRRGGGKAGGEAIAAAVDDALRWLMNHQNLGDGHWSCAAFDEECGRQDHDYKEPCDGQGSPQFDVGVTGLALLAYLGAGNTHKEGKYKKTVKAGLRYLVDVQSPDGNFGNKLNGKYTYDHLIATLAMVEAYALTKDYMFKSSAERSLQYMYSIRNKTLAWRYAPDAMGMEEAANDMSVTGWAILAMTLAKEYNMPFDETALMDSLSFLEEMTDPDGVTGYFKKGEGPAREPGVMTERWPQKESDSMTAVGVLCRIFADPGLNRPGNKAMVEKGVKRIAELPPIWDDNQPGRRDFYFWYYGTYALYQYGGPAWNKWEKGIVDAVAKTQEKTPEQKGSWDPSVDPWGREGGRVYATAILCLTMEVFYRYATVMGSH
jgi:hypothetical protein